MGTLSNGGNAPLNTLKPQPGQYNSYHPKFHPLPGPWAQEQLNGSSQPQRQSSKGNGHPQTEVQRAISAENAQHEYWEKWQGVTPGKAIYENPREMQNTLLPSAKYGTEGRGYG
jgi:hypothetical protein